jgi:hypothetical protein
MICPAGKAENIFDQGWTGQIRLKCFGKFGFTRQCWRRILMQEAGSWRSYLRMLSKLDVSPDVICRTAYRLH